MGTSYWRGELWSGHCLLIPALQRHAMVQAPDPAFSLYAEPLRIAASDLQRCVEGVEASLPKLQAALAARLEQTAQTLR